MNISITGTLNEVHEVLDRLTPNDYAHDLAIQMLVRRTDDLQDGISKLLGVKDGKKES